MKNWTNTSWLARRLCAALLALLAVAMPAHAFQKTALADGGFEYFFAAPSLDIRGVGDLDLTGLSFIEGVTGGFRVGASFDLDWLGGENAWLASPFSTWSGLDTQPRAVSVAAVGALRFEDLRLSLPGGSFSFTAGESLIFGGTTTIEVGSSGSVVIGSPGPAVPPAPTFGGVILVSGGSGSRATIDFYPPLTIGSRNIPITPGGGTLVFLSPIPEPATAALMLAGLLALAGVAARRAKAEG